MTSPLNHYRDDSIYIHTYLYIHDSISRHDMGATEEDAPTHVELYG